MRQDSLMTENDDNKFKLNVIFKLNNSKTSIEKVNQNETNVCVEINELVVCFERHHKHSKLNLKNNSVHAYE